MGLEAGPNSLWRRSRRRFYWLLAHIFIFLGRCLPISWGRRLGQGLAGWVPRLRPRDVAIASDNLLTAFPELDSAGRALLLRRSLKALGSNLFDMLAAPRLLARSNGVVCETVGESQSRGLVEALTDLAGRNRGVLILTGHLGCWELLGAWLAREVPAAHLGPLGVVTGTIHNEPVDRLVQGRRLGLGMKVLPREEGVRPLLDHLRSGGVVAVLLDQNTRVQNLSVPFFGKPAPTAAGFAKIILQHGIPVLPVAIARQGEGHVVRHLEPILTEPRRERAPEPEAVLKLLAECNLALEQLIRRNPAEWVWFHKRWDAKSVEPEPDGALAEG